MVLAGDLFLPRAQIQRLAALNYKGISMDFVRDHLASLHRSMGEGQPVKVAKAPGRNAPCTCGSGRKYKVCCGR